MYYYSTCWEKKINLDSPVDKQKTKITFVDWVNGISYLLNITNPRLGTNIKHLATVFLHVDTEGRVNESLIAAQVIRVAPL